MIPPPFSSTLRPFWRRRTHCVLVRELAARIRDPASRRDSPVSNKDRASLLSYSKTSRNRFKPSPSRKRSPFDGPALLSALPSLLELLRSARVFSHSCGRRFGNVASQTMRRGATPAIINGAYTNAKSGRTHFPGCSPPPLLEQVVPILRPE